MRVAAHGHGELRTLADREAITGLGRGLRAAGRLDDAAVARTVEALARFAAEAHALGAAVRCVGTSALRDAPDRERFVAAARERAGVEVEVISGAREAELTFRGACDGLGLADGVRVVVVDVGGGSTELARGPVGGAPERAVSVQVGSVRLLSLVEGDPPSPASLAALHTAIDGALDDASPPFSHGAPLVALAGTALTVGGLLRGIPQGALGRLHGATLGAEEVSAAAAEIASRTLAARAADPSIGGPRADVIVPGSAIFAAVVRRSGAPEVRLSGGGVRVGLLREALDRSGFSE